FAVSSDELDRGGVSYTVDTLERLKALHPHDDLRLLLGPDAVLGLPSWREPNRILQLAGIVAMERESLDDLGAPAHRAALEPLFGREGLERLLVERVKLPAIGIRASALRAAVAAGRSIRYRTPRAVERYIAAHGLYRDGWAVGSAPGSPPLVSDISGGGPRLPRSDQ
ncbi:MAG: nicotinate-nicotinamide nucleotide adenylyltransferase, partial [Planctomycetia bacterium]